MNTEILTKYWQIEKGRITHDLIPIDKSKHYAGDECWCKPNRLKLDHYNAHKLNLDIWVHKPSDEIERRDLNNALASLVTGWDETQKISQ